MYHLFSGTLKYKAVLVTALNIAMAQTGKFREMFTSPRIPPARLR